MSSCGYIPTYYGPGHHTLYDLDEAGTFLNKGGDSKAPETNQEAKAEEAVVAEAEEVKSNEGNPEEWQICETDGTTTTVSPSETSTQPQQHSGTMESEIPSVDGEWIFSGVL